MAVDNYKKRAYGAYYPRMVHMGSIWEIQAKLVFTSQQISPKGVPEMDIEAIETVIERYITHV